MVACTSAARCMIESILPLIVVALLLLESRANSSMMSSNSPMLLSSRTSPITLNSLTTACLSEVICRAIQIHNGRRAWMIASTTPKTRHYFSGRTADLHFQTIHQLRFDISSHLASNSRNQNISRLDGRIPAMRPNRQGAMT